MPEWLSELLTGSFVVCLVLLYPVWFHAFLRFANWWVATLDASYGRLIRFLIACVDTFFDHLDEDQRHQKGNP